MKKIILSLLILIGCSSLYAAQPNYEPTMKGILMKMKSAQSIEAYDNAANAFVRVSEVEKEEWLPLYYAAMCNIMEASMMKDGKDIDAKLDIADELITKAQAINYNDELLCLQSWSKSTRIMVNPMSRGQKFGMESANLLERAISINPANPRAYFLKGQSMFYTPEEFGGGRAKALEFFNLAKSLYQKSKLETEISPSWGADQTDQMIDLIVNGEKKTPQTDKAVPAKKTDKK